MKRILLLLGAVVFWVGAQGQLTAPFTESFDNTSIPTGWTNTSSSTSTNANWKFSGTPGNPSMSGSAYNPPVILDHTGNSGSIAWSDGSTPAVADCGLLTDSIDPSSLTSLFLEFWIYSNNVTNAGDNNTIYVNFYDGTQWNDSIWGYAGDGVNWQYVGIDLSTFTTSGNILFEFVVDQTTAGTAFYNDILLDDISVKNVPPCPLPLNFDASNITATTADVSWTAVSAASSYEVISGVEGFDPATAGTSQTTTTTSATVTGLSGATTYDMYLIADCGSANGISDTAGPVKVTTLCVPFTATYSNNFDSETDGQVAQCWEQYNSYNSFAYARVENLGTPRSGTQQLALYNYFNFSANDTLIGISPEFSDLTGGDKQIRFHVKPSIDNLRLFVLTLDGSTSSANGTFIDTIDLPTANVYQEVILPLTTANGYNGTDTYVGFAFDLSNTSNTFDYIYIDDFFYEVIPTCPKVSNPFLAGITPNSATIGFTGPGTAWQYEFGPAGFTQGTNAAGLVSATSNPFTITGLPGNTEHDVYIRNDCGGGDTSVWEGPFTFRTLCNPFTAPYYNGFENDPLDLNPLCWSSIVTEQFSFVEVEDFTFTAAPFAGSQALYIYARNSTLAADTVLSITPSFSDLTAGDKRIRFQANSDDPATELLIATTSSPLGDSAFNYIDTINFPTPDTYQEVIVNFNAANGYNGTDTYIVLQHNYGGTFDYIRIDEFNYELAPACVPPTTSSLGAFNVTASGADVFWGSGSAGVKTMVEVGPVGFTPGTGIATFSDSVAGTVDTLLGVTGLASQTDYEFYVRDSCSSAGYSPWVGPFSFTTLCTAQLAPYTEDFENFTVGYFQGIENCWTIRNGAGPGLASNTSGYSWELRNTAQTSSGTSTGPSLDNTLAPTTGGKFFNADVSYTLGDSSILESPLVDVSALQRPSLEFYLHRYGSRMGDFFVDIYDGTQWNRGVISLTNLQGTQTSQTDPYTKYEINLDPYVSVGNQIVQARFRTINNGCCAGDNGLDDIAFVNGPACPNPAGLTVTNLTSSGGDVNLGVSTNATAFNIEYGPTGFIQGSGTGTLVTGVSTLPYTIPGLSPNSFYDVYIQVDCGTDGTSIWIGPVTFKTNCVAALAGTYTIGGAAGASNFATLDSAVAVLNGCGISGPVTFNFSGGNSYPNVTMTAIQGASATNTVTFNGNVLNPDTLGGFDIIGSDWVTFNDLYMARPNGGFAVRLSDQANNNTFDGCTLVGIPGTTSSLNTLMALSSSSTSFAGAGNNANNLTVDNCYFQGGYAAITAYGLASDKQSGLFYNNNTLDGQYNYGFYFFQSDSMEVYDNVMVNGLGSTFGYGVFSSSSDRGVFERNEMITGSRYGMYWFNANQSLSGRNTRVVNNIMDGSLYALYLNGSDNMDVYHNTAFGARGLYITSTGQNIDVRNNVFASTAATNYAAYINTTPTNFTFDYNALDTTIGLAGFSGGTGYAGLAAWQTADATINANSVEGQVGFVSPTNLRLLGTVANNVGDNSLNVTQDIDGEIRPAAGATTVDMGADEYTPVTEDIAIDNAVFDRNSACLTSNDTLVVTISNQIGATKNFATTNLTIGYDITGPINTSGTFTLNAGTLALGSALDVRVPGVDMSAPGTYTLAQAYIAPNADNLTAVNDTLFGTASELVRELFKATPDTVVFVNSPTDTVQIKTQSPLLTGGTFFFTEIMHFRTGTGSPTGGWPSYMGTSGADLDEYVEVTGVPGSDLSGYTFEQWNTTGTTPTGTVTFGPGTVLSPNGTALLTMRSTFVTSPTNYLYDGGGGNTVNWQSGGGQGVILKDPSGNIVDAVGYSSSTTAYTFPAAANVPSADWNGGTPGSASGTCGIRLEGADLNDATNWLVSSSTAPQDPNTVNTSVLVPSPTGTAGFSWELNGSTYGTNPDTIVTGFTNSGVFNYIATYTSVCGLLQDTVTIIVNLGCPTPSNFNATVNSCDDVDFDWVGAGDSSLVYVVPAGGTPTGAGNLVINDSTFNYTAGAPNTSYDVYIANICSGDTITAVGPFGFSIADEGAPFASFTVNQSGLTLAFDGTGSTGSGLSYAWDFGDGNTGAGATTTNTYATGGSYSITLTVTNACGTDDTTITVGDVSVQENMLSNSLALYPNPATDEVRVSFALQNTGDATIRVVEMGGKEVINQAVSGNGEYAGSLDISSLARGVYTVEISAGDLTATRRLIKN